MKIFNYITELYNKNKNLNLRKEFERKKDLINKNKLVSYTYRARKTKTVKYYKS